MCLVHVFFKFSLISYNNQDLLCFSFEIPNDPHMLCKVVGQYMPVFYAKACCICYLVSYVPCYSSRDY